MNVEQMTVIKRDGREVAFNSDKIKVAIEKGFNSVNQLNDENVNRVLKSTIAKIEEFDVNKIEIERIQDLVEEAYIDEGFIEAYKSFKNYRKKRALAREYFTRGQHKLMKTLEDYGIKDSSEVNDKRENANINGDSAMGLMLKYGSTLSKAYTTSYCLDPKVANAMEEGDIHIHDMDFYPMGTTTCDQIPLDHLFENGFNTGHGYLRSPKSISSYAALAAIAIQSNQNDQHGGQSVAMFDYYMAPGVIMSYKKAYKRELNDFQEYTSYLSEQEHRELLEKIDNLNDLTNVSDDPKLEVIFNKALAAVDRETFQAMEGIVHNLNTMHSRAGAQVPFSSINFGTDTSKAGRMVTKNLILAQEAGLGNHETPIFPILIFKCKDGVNYNPGDPNYDLFKLAIRCSAKRMFPNFSFIDAPFNLQYYKPGHPETEVTYMGCRTRVIGNTAVPEHDGIVVGRGNLSFTSINLPRLGIKHGILKNEKPDIEGFYKEFFELMDLVKDQLLARLELQKSKRVKNFPFLMGLGCWLGSEKLGEDDVIGDILNEGTLSIGFIGLAECLKALVGKHHGEDEEAYKLGLEIITKMRERCDEYSKQYGLNFTCLATPAEGLSGRFIKIDQERYGKIEGVTDREYYTNSFHIPVYYHISMYDKIQKEAPFHALTNAGHISYIEYDGDPSQNLEAFERIIRMMHDAGMGYGAINHPLDRCPCCGYSGIINDECPRCHRKENEWPTKATVNELLKKGFKIPYETIINARGE
ncbi:MAG: anaerobic ribonucleoside triphosphate reductase [Erysipelotrichaceae bacterium]|nr:anaerobic ribonucleoside triphosphate reductase [Erysipelotrichaceae bacterium]